MTNDEPAVYPPVGSVDEIIALTDEYWRGWSSRCQQDVPYREAVVRSALTLKLLSFSPSGAVVASPTTSLPEVPGGDKNWDYRYCWLRDASLTVRAFKDLGYEEEASAFAQWILHATRQTRPKLRVLYDVYGRTPGAEKEIEGVSGYRGALPVRAGNLAMDQVQLDVYGEVLDAVAATEVGERRLSRDERLFLEEVIRYATDHWREADSGIWEMRGEPRQYVESKVMCWLAATRGAELAERGVLHMSAQNLRNVADEMREAILLEGYDRRHDAFRDALGGEGLDAALLRLPLVGFCEPGDALMEGTIDAIRERLCREDLVYRREDEMRSGEGAFVICSFWLVDCLARAGRVAEASEVFERLLSKANDLGLYAEEIDAESGAFRGNFPLAFSHVGLINAAVSIGRGGGG
jgi:GH15 family glucan-1,4-alpha-glucosidase